MQVKLTHQKYEYACDLSQPLNISIPLGQVNCFHATSFKVSPYRSGDFVGSVKAGAPVNFFDVQMNPHGNGTHTECLGHITLAHESVNAQLNRFHFMATLVSVALKTNAAGDKIISKDALEQKCKGLSTEALIIRTLPNEQDKQVLDYSDTNPPYLETQAMQYIVDQNIEHLLLDLPSVDRERDEGKLAAHHIFWNVSDHKASDSSRVHCTISELIFVPNEIPDGVYLLNLQIPNMQLDAAPSQPVLYALQKLN